MPHIPDPRIHYQHKRQPKPEIPIDLCKSGPMKALVAVRHTMLVAAWNMLTNGDLYRDPGADYFSPGASPRRPERAPSASSNHWATASSSNPSPAPHNHTPDHARPRQAHRDTGGSPPPDLTRGGQLIFVRVGNLTAAPASREYNQDHSPA